MERLNAQERDRAHILRMIEIKRHRINCLSDYGLYRDRALVDLKDYVIQNLKTLLPEQDSCPDPLKEALHETQLPEWVEEAHSARVEREPQFVNI